MARKKGGSAKRGDSGKKKGSGKKGGSGPKSTSKSSGKNKSTKGSKKSDKKNKNNGIQWEHEPQIKYRLSDKAYIERGWTLLPREKVSRQIISYNALPAKPRSNLFGRLRLTATEKLFYPDGSPLARFKKTGEGTIFYPGRRRAIVRQLTPQNTLRHVVMSPGGKDPRTGRIRVPTVCAIFDSLGYGVVYDEDGKVRLAFSQKRGVLLDTANGLPVKWTWPVKLGDGDKVLNQGKEETVFLPIPEGGLVKEDEGDGEETVKVEVSEKAEEEGAKGRKKKGGSAKGSDKGKKKHVKSDEESTKESEKGKKKRGKSEGETAKGKKKNKKGAGGSVKKEEEVVNSEPESSDTVSKSVKGKHKKDKGKKTPVEEIPVKEESLPKIVETQENVDEILLRLKEVKKKQVNEVCAPVKPILLNLNEFLNLRLVDQSCVNVELRAQKLVMRLELGVVVDGDVEVRVETADPRQYVTHCGVPNMFETFHRKSLTTLLGRLDRQRARSAIRQAERKVVQEDSLDCKHRLGKLLACKFQ